MKEYEISFTDRELYAIVQGLQCFSYMIENGHVTYNGDETEETVNALLDTIALKIANVKGVELEKI